ncbi:MAG: hypothetical protein WAU32_01575 [Thermoanaerobaculia bacterium]
MKPPLLARLVLASFVWIFVLAATYLLLDAFGLWARLPVGLTHAVEVGTGLILLFVLLAHLGLSAGGLPSDGGDRGPRPL